MLRTQVALAAPRLPKKFDPKNLLWATAIKKIKKEIKSGTSEDTVSNMNQNLSYDQLQQVYDHLKVFPGTYVNGKRVRKKAATKVAPVVKTKEAKAPKAAADPNAKLNAILRKAESVCKKKNIPVITVVEYTGSKDGYVQLGAAYAKYFISADPKGYQINRLDKGKFGDKKAAVTSLGLTDKIAKAKLLMTQDMKTGSAPIGKPSAKEPRVIKVPPKADSKVPVVKTEPKPTPAPKVKGRPWQFVPGQYDQNVGTVLIDGKEVRAALINKGAYITVLEQRFKEGDKITRPGKRGRDADVVAEVRFERSRTPGAGLWRYTFASRGWARDMFKAGGSGSDAIQKTGESAPEELQQAQEKLGENKAKQGNKLKALVENGTLSKGMNVKVRAPFGMTRGVITDFNFESGMVKVATEHQSMARMWGVGKKPKQWFKRIFRDDDRNYILWSMT